MDEPFVSFDCLEEAWFDALENGVFLKGWNYRAELAAAMLERPPRPVRNASPITGLGHA